MIYTPKNIRNLTKDDFKKINKNNSDTIKNNIKNSLSPFMKF